MLKALERLAKTLLALTAGVLLFRPWRRARARSRLIDAQRILLVRIDRRVGEALLTTPLIAALAQAQRGWEIDVVVDGRCAPLLEATPGVRRVLAFDRRALALGPLAPGIRALRNERYDVLVDCSNWTAPSVTAALVTRLAASTGVVIGPPGLGVSGLRDLVVRPRTDTCAEVLQRLKLLEPLLPSVPQLPLSFRSVETIAVPTPLRDWSEGGSYAVVNPGGRLGWRRVPSELFVAAGRAFAERGLRVIVTWGPGELALAEEVARGIFDSKLAPPTSLDELAWLLGHARAAVTNNTGPMHLSVAVGTATLGLFLKMDPARWGHHHAPHQMLDLTPVLARGDDGTPAVRSAVSRLLDGPLQGGAAGQK